MSGLWRSIASKLPAHCGRGWIVFLVPLTLAARSALSAEALPQGPLEPSTEERLDQQVDPGLSYRVVVSAPTPIVPSATLPPGLELQQANNNLSIALHDGRLFLAFRTAPTHFASPLARLIVLSSPDLGKTWTHEASFVTGRDLREPFLLEVDQKLFLYFAELGRSAYAFEPHALLRSSRCGVGCWTAPEKWGGPGEIAWDFKVRGGRAFMTSYRGKHYDLQAQTIEIRFRSSIDGVDWKDVGQGPVYRGGATEASFEFDRQGGLWAITRNEDGDVTGFGSLVARAEPATPGSWRFPVRSNPSRFDSPRLFRHGPDIYLVARRDLGPPAGARFESAPGEMRKLLGWASYSLQPKRTALYRLDPTARRFELVLDLPSAADTAFPSIVRLSPHEFLVANYTSPLSYADRSWFWGQMNATGIYFVRLRFEPVGPNDPPARLSSGTTQATIAGPGFAEDWPMRKSGSGRLAGVGTVAVGALVVARLRRRRVEVGRRPETPASPAA